MRLVLDTNTVVSALLWRGAPYRLVAAADTHELFFFTSPFLLAELEEVLGRAHLSAAATATGLTLGQIMARYRAISVAVLPTSVPAVARDPDDNHVLACAAAARADLIVSGDSDLLTLVTYEGIAIVNAAETLRRIVARM